METMRHGHATAVIGQGNVLIAPRLSGSRHGLNAGRAVCPVGMDVKITANVGKGHKMREVVCAGGRYLAAILPQFRFNERKSELLINLLLRGAGNPPLTSKQAVLVQFPAVL